MSGSQATFATFKLHPSLLRGLKELGFVRPTPIQGDAIPPGLDGKDVLACAMTGSGKTAAFLLPILNRLIDRPRGKTRALVIAPTRELAAQILESLNGLAVHTPITAAAVFGGVGMGAQEHAIRSGVDVLIATPGRLLDHLRAPYTKLDHVEHLVLDEADRMLDMGFLPEIRKVLRYVPTKRQTLFFSATMPPAIQALSRELLHHPVSINVERRSAPAVGITQAIYPVRQELKTALLLALLNRHDIEQVLIFTRTKHRANRLAEALEKGGVPAGRIHGNRSQAQRTAALAGFKSGEVRVLVATDIVARGIDVEALGHVINFDVPMVPEDYIHRVGRTARNELTGEAFTFVAPEEEGELRAIEKAVGRALPRVTIPDFDYHQAVTTRLEIPLKDRIAEIRARKAEDRKRAAEKAARREASRGGGGASPRPASGSGPSRSTQGTSPTSRGGGGAGARPASGSGPSRPTHGTSSSARAGEGRSQPQARDAESPYRPDGSSRWRRRRPR